MNNERPELPEEENLAAEIEADLSSTLPTIEAAEKTPPKKRRFLGLSSFFLGLLALLCLASFAAIALIALKNRSLDIGHIHTLSYAVIASCAMAAVGFLLAVTTFFLRRQKKGFAVFGVILSLFALLISGGMIYGYHYIFGDVRQDADFNELPSEAIYVAQTEADGEIIRETEEITTVAPEVIESIIEEDPVEEIEWEHLTDDDIPEEARQRMDTERPTSSSYLLSGHEQISNYLLLGADDGNSSDAMIVLSLDRVHQKIKLISIPRDSYVLIPAWGTYAKLAYAYHWGGAEWAVGVVNRNFTFNISEYIAVDMEQLADIIDLAGGVDVDLDYAEVKYLSYNHSGIHYGLCHLDGAAAVTYARIRSSNASDNEIKRTGRQREVLMSLLDSAFEMPMTDYPEFIRACLGMCTTSFNNYELMSLCMEVLQGNYTVEQYALIDYVDYWGGVMGQEQYFYLVYDLDRASDALYRIVYEDLYVSGYDDGE